MRNTTLTGNEAEKAVADELSRQGFIVIKLNWKTAFAEIDVIAQKNKTVYFVEVKYRSSETAGDGFDYITTHKLKHMTRAAESWVLQNNWHDDYMLMAASVVEGKGIDLREIT